MFAWLTGFSSRSSTIRQLTCRFTLERLEGRALPAVHFSINPQQQVAPISRFIYGVNQDLTGAYANLTYTRTGGNRWTAYNWENNASNAGSDWFFQNDDYLGGGNTPGGAIIPRLQNAYARNAGALITVPINGYVAADKNGGGDVRNSGPDYLQTRFKHELPTKGAPFSLTPDPNDAYVYQDEFVNWLKTNYAYGQTDPNRPIWFSLDNEPDLWAETHGAIHPNRASYAELVQKTIDYARAIKDVEPGTKVFGAANYGWYGFETLQDAPDANGRNFLDFYLQQLRQAETTYGKRLLDVMDVHWYPEATGGGVRITGEDTSPAVVAARLQAPRSLWDPTYTETSWITQYSTLGPINLLPRLKGQVAANYAGTKLSISEYNYGGGGHISGGIAQADVLGIFGREGVFAANEWALGANEAFIAAAFNMYRNFDGAGGTFGDTSVQATTDDVAGSSVYASVDAANPNVMTLVVINKTAQPLTSLMQLAQVQSGASVDIYQLTGAAAGPQFAGHSTLADPANFSYTMPAYSVSTIRIVSPPSSPGATVTITGTAQDDTFTFNTGATHRVTLNGVTTTYDPAVVRTIHFDGKGGRDTATLTGGSGAEQAHLRPGTGALVSSSYRVDMTSVEAIVVNGGAGDTAFLYDAAGNDTFTGTPLTSYLAGAGFANRVNGFTRVDVYASAGNDTAALHDSGGTDTFLGTPAFSYLSGPNYLNKVSGFKRVDAYASMGNDTAALFDSNGNDTFLGTPTFSYLSGTGFLNKVNGFKRVDALASAGNDTAALFDSNGNDAFVGTPAFSSMSGAGYLNKASAFKRVDAYASAGTDTATLHDSSGNDSFMATPLFAFLTGAGYLNKVSGFDRVDAYASTGSDYAEFHDSPGDDLFQGAGSKGAFTGPGYNQQCWSFDRVRIYADQGGIDRASVGGIDYVFEKIGVWL